MSIRTAAPALAGGVGAGEQLVARVAAVAITAVKRVIRRRIGVALGLGAAAGNVQHDFEFQQVCAGGNRIRVLTGVSVNSWAGGPGLECLVGFPLGYNEIAIFAFDRAQQLETEETWLIVDRVGAMREALLQLRSGALGYLDCIDFHDGHGARLPRRQTPLADRGR